MSLTGNEHYPHAKLNNIYIDLYYIDNDLEINGGLTVDGINTGSISSTTINTQTIQIAQALSAHTITCTDIEVQGHTISHGISNTGNIETINLAVSGTINNLHIPSVTAENKEEFVHSGVDLAHSQNLLVNALTGAVYDPRILYPLSFLPTAANPLQSIHMKHHIESLFTKGLITSTQIGMDVAYLNSLTSSAINSLPTLVQGILGLFTDGTISLDVNAFLKTTSTESLQIRDLSSLITTVFKSKILARDAFNNVIPNKNFLLPNLFLTTDSEGYLVNKTTPFNDFDDLDQWKRGKDAKQIENEARWVAQAVKDMEILAASVSASIAAAVAASVAAATPAATAAAISAATPAAVAAATTAATSAGGAAGASSGGIAGAAAVPGAVSPILAAFLAEIKIINAAIQAETAASASAASTSASASSASATAAQASVAACTSAVTTCTASVATSTTQATVATTQAGLSSGFAAAASAAAALAAVNAISQKGDQGAQGAQGTKGDKGDKGDTGSPGTNGTSPDTSVFAPINSPIFTGTTRVTAPLASDDSDAVPSTAWVKTAVATNLASYPTNSSFNTTLALYAPINSPNFTGNARVNAPNSADDSDSIPSTHWVRFVVAHILQPYLTSTTAASTYQPLGSYAISTSLNDYLTIANASLIYQPIGSYLTTASAANTYQPIGSYATVASLTSYVLTSVLNTVLSSYITSAFASTTYATQTSLNSYVLTSAFNTALNSYLTSALASTTYATQTSLTSYVLTSALNTALSSYLTSATAASTYTLQSSLANYALKASPTFTGTITIPALTLTGIFTGVAANANSYLALNSSNQIVLVSGGSSSASQSSSSEYTIANASNPTLFIQSNAVGTIGTVFCSLGVGTTAGYYYAGQLANDSVIQASGDLWHGGAAHRFMVGTAKRFEITGTYLATTLETMYMTSATGLNFLVLNNDTYIGRATGGSLIDNSQTGDLCLNSRAAGSSIRMTAAGHTSTAFQISASQVTSTLGLTLGSNLTFSTTAGIYLTGGINWYIGGSQKGYFDAGSNSATWRISTAGTATDLVLNASYNVSTQIGGAYKLQVLSNQLIVDVPIYANSGIIAKDDSGANWSPQSTTDRCVEFIFARGWPGRFADGIVLNTYIDGTGGNDNLLLLSKSGIAMRIYQQAFNSASSFYSGSYADAVLQNSSGNVEITNRLEVLGVGSSFGGASSNGVLNIKNPNGDYTHFGWTNGINYIRGPTECSTTLKVDGLLTVSSYFEASSSYVRTVGVENISAGQDDAQYRAIFSSRGIILRNDDSNFYFLITASGDPYGSWNTLRPLYFNIPSGVLYSDNGQVFKGGLETTTLRSSNIIFSDGYGLQTNQSPYYGNVSTLGSGTHNWPGYSIGSRITFMASTDGNTSGVHDLNNSWLIRWENGVTYYDRPTFIYNALPQQTYSPQQVLIGQNGGQLQWGAQYSQWKYENSNWAGGLFVGGATKNSDNSFLRLSGWVTKYSPNSARSNFFFRFYNNTTGLYYDYYQETFVNTTYNHECFGVMISVQLPAGNYGITIYAGSNMITDTNDFVCILTECVHA